MKYMSMKSVRQVTADWAPCDVVTLNDVGKVQNESGLQRNEGCC